MKRSDAITEIVKKIELMRGVDNGYYVYPEDDVIAETILSGLEENVGMRPPYDSTLDDGVDTMEWEPE